MGVPFLAEPDDLIFRIIWHADEVFELVVVDDRNAMNALFRSRCWNEVSMNKLTPFGIVGPWSEGRKRSSSDPSTQNNPNREVFKNHAQKARPRICLHIRYNLKDTLENAG